MSDDTSRERMERAIRVVRREGQKAAVISATVEAVAALLAVDLLLGVVPVAQLPAELDVPDALAASGAFDTLDTVAVLAVVAGLATFGLALWLRLRRPLVERFEAVNPDLAETLRTARDAAEAGTESRMAARLYEESIEGLGEASSLGLLDVRRIAATLVVIAVLAPATIGVTAAGFEVVLGGDDADAAAGPEVTEEYEGLQNPDSVLGEADDVDAGSEDINATVGSQGGGGNSSRAAPGAYETGFEGSGSVEAESQQAGFAEQERLEDAELIREYNLRIRQTEDEDTQ